MEAIELSDLVEFCERNKRLPNSSVKGIESKLYRFLYKNRSNPEVSELVNKYRSRSEFRTFNENLNLLIEFCEKNGRMPRSSVSNEMSLYVFYNRIRDKNKTVIELCRKYNVKRNKSFKENLNELIKFCEDHNRLPSTNSRTKEESRLYSFIKRYRETSSKISSICDKYRRYRSFEYSFHELVLFCIKNNRLPKYNIPSEKWMYSFYYRNINNKAMSEITKKYKTKSHKND